MNARDLQRALKAAPWSTTEELDAFVQQAVEELTAQDLAKCLDIYTDRKLSRDAGRHRIRCSALSKLGSLLADRALFVPYVRALKAADPQSRNVLASLIPKVNNVQAHGELCSLLRSPDQHLRKVAAGILTQIGGKATVQLLGRMAQERNLPGRPEAMDVLVETAGHYAVTPLEQVAIGRSFPVDHRIHALKYLGDSQYMARVTSKAVKAIQRVLGDGNETVRSAAIDAYTRMCTEEEYFEHIAEYLFHPNLRYVKVAVTGLARFHSRRVIVQLERKLRAGPNAIRMVVLTTLEQIGRNEALPPLVEALSFKQINVRTRAGEIIRGLAASGKVDVARTIVWLLRSKDVNVRRMAVEIASSIKDDKDELWPKLLGCLRDEDWWVRERVIDALVEMAGTKLTRHVVGYLKDESDILRRFGVGVLGKLKDPQALGTLVRVAQNDSDWWVREKAIEAIAAIGDMRAVPYIVDLMLKNEELQLVSLFALKKLGPADALKPITKLLNDTEDDDIRYAALQCLEELDDPANIETVKGLVHHDRSQIRVLSRQLLRQWQVKVDAKSALDDESISLLDRYLIHLQEEGGEDLILAAGQRPMMKKMGVVYPLSERALSPKLVSSLLIPMLKGSQLQDLDALKDVDFSYEVKSAGLRFRVNLFQTLSGLSAVFREIRDVIPDLETLGLPPVVEKFGDLKNGLVLMGGPTGSGKSTTLAALINYINANYDRHIISIEDPIEVVHERKRGLVNQRELGTHTGHHHHALRATLRQDPDVILVGELRDYPTISFAVSAAETGHLVFGTVHTVSAANTVDRLINAFPGGQAEQVRSMISDSLQAVVCQHLLRRVNGKGRILAVEVMINTEAIANLIRKGKAYQIPGIMATNRKRGMQLMDDHLMELYKSGQVHAEEVYMKALNKADFESVFDPTKLGKRKVEKPPQLDAPPETPWAKQERQTGPTLETPPASAEPMQELVLEEEVGDAPAEQAASDGLILEEVTGKTAAPRDDS